MAHSTPARPRLRAHLLALALALVLPTLALAAAAAWQAVAGHRAAAEARLRDTAHALALAMDREIAGVAAALTAFATSPAFGADAEAADLPVLHAQARALAGQLGAAVFVARRDGTRLLTTRVPLGTPTPPVSSSEMVERALSTGRPAVGNLVIGSIVREPVFGIAVPVPGRELIAAATFHPARLHALLGTQGAPLDAFSAVADARNVLVARSDAQHDALVGRPLPAPNIRAFAGQAGGVYRAKALDGEDRVFGFHAVPSAPGWTVFVAAPASAFTAAWRGPLISIAGGGALALALGLVVAVTTTRRMLGPLNALTERAEAVAQAAGGGALGVAAAPPSRIREFERLRLAVEAAQAALVRRAELARAATEALAAREQLLSAIGRSTPDPIFAKDAEGRMLYANPATLTLIGRPAEEVLGRTDLEWLPDAEQARAVMANDRRVMTRGEAELVEERVADAARGGEERVWLSNKAPLRDTAGRVVGLVGVSRDVTEERQAQSALAAGEARWRGLFERMQEGFMLCELLRDAAGRPVDFRFLELNAAWRSLTGVPPGAVIGRLASEAIPGLEPFWLETYARVVETGEPAQFEHRAAPLGRWFEVMAYRVEEGRFAALFFDVTQRKEAEERQALLAREVDHRAKNALAVVQSVVGLTRAEDAAGFRAAVTGRIAAMARAHTILAREGWDGAEFRELAEQELAPHRGTDGSRVILRGPDVGIAPEATQPLAMALHELATNAAKYGALSAAGGRVLLEWRPEEATGGLLICWREEDGPRLEGPPSRRGFGSSMIERTVERQLRGRVTFGWHPHGLRCEISLPPAMLRAGVARRALPAAE